MQIELNTNLIVWNNLSLQIHIYVILIEKIKIGLEQTKKTFGKKMPRILFFFYKLNFWDNTSKIDYTIVFNDIIYLGIK